MSSPKPLLLLLLPLACGQPPVPVSSSSDEGGEAHAAMPAASDPHAGLERQATYEGVVRLQGELATRRDGFLFVSLKLPGVGFPVYSAKLSLAPREGEEGTDGDERVLPFRLDERNKLGVLTDDDHVVEVMLDVDGYVESKDDILARASVPVEPNQTGIEVVLAPAAGE